MTHKLEIIEEPTGWRWVIWVQRSRGFLRSRRVLEGISDTLEDAVIAAVRMIQELKEVKETV